MKLRELRPCDNCGKPIGSIFHTIKYSFAVVDQKALREYVGMTTMMGPGSGMVVEALGAHQDDAVKFLGDQEDGPGWVLLFLCNDCFVAPEWSLGQMLEKLQEEAAK